MAGVDATYLLMYDKLEDGALL